MKISTLYGIAIFFFTFNLDCHAQSLDKILTKHYEAVGQNARNQLRSMFLEVKEINELNDEKNYSIILKKPNKIRIEGVWEGQNYISAFDGVRAWTIAPWTGVTIPQLMTFDETDDIRAIDGINSPLFDFQQNLDDIDLKGQVKIDDDSYHILRVNSIEKPVMDYYLNTKNNMLYKSMRYSRANDTLLVEEVRYSNFSKHNIPDQGDINIPMTLEIFKENSKVELIITEVILGFGAPNSFFTKPE